MPRKQAYLKIRGRVQGVCYRANAERAALQLDLTGWVRNCDDGSVECLAEGEESHLQDFIAWAHRGPRHAIVETVDVGWSDYTGIFRTFGIDE